MLELSKEDLLQIKCMVRSSGFIIDTVTLNGIKSFQELKDTLNDDPVLNDTVRNGIINQVLYFTNCFGLLHTNKGCLGSYKFSDILISKEMILLVRLFQDLRDCDFDDLLKDCFEESLERFQSLQMEFDKLDSEACEQKITTWLNEHQKDLLKQYEPIFELKLSSDVVSQQCQGLCFIINNEMFSKPDYPKRQGTAKDEKKIRETFTKLGYEIMIKRDVPYNSMEKFINVAKKNFKEHHKKLVVFVLSHGEKKHIITSDCKKFEYKKLISMFDDSKHIELLKKKKLFFFVCCRGSNIDTGQQIESDGLTNCPDTEDIECDAALKKVPTHGGKLIAFAAYKCYRNYRHPVNGTFYINSLCDNINKKPTRDIMKIYTFVQSEVKDKVFLAKEEFQIPYIKSSLGPCALLEVL